MSALEEQLQSRGLEVLGNCQNLSAMGPSLLQNAALLEDMNAQEVDALGAAMVRVRAQPGQVLITEGETGDWMLLILSGTVDVAKSVLPPGATYAEAAEANAANAAAPANASGAGDNRTTAESASEREVDASSRLAVLRAGAAIGEMSMLDSEPRYATCVAIDTVEAGVLGRLAIAHLIREHPSVGAKLLVKITQLMAQRLRNTSNRLMRMLQKK